MNSSEPINPVVPQPPIVAILLICFTLFVATLGVAFMLAPRYGVDPMHPFSWMTPAPTFAEVMKAQKKMEAGEINVTISSGGMLGFQYGLREEFTTQPNAVRMSTVTNGTEAEMVALDKRLFLSPVAASVVLKRMLPSAGVSKLPAGTWIELDGSNPFNLFSNQDAQAAAKSAKTAADMRSMIDRVKNAVRQSAQDGAWSLDDVQTKTWNGTPIWDARVNLDADTFITTLSNLGEASSEKDKQDLKTQITKWQKLIVTRVYIARSDMQIIGGNIQLQLTASGQSFNAEFSLNSKSADQIHIEAPTNVMSIDEAKKLLSPNATTTSPVDIDTDHDGLSDEQEYLHGTDIHNPDTDGDGFTDKQEIDSKHDPLQNAKTGKRFPPILKPKLL